MKALSTILMAIGFAFLLHYTYVQYFEPVKLPANQLEFVSPTSASEKMILPASGIDSLRLDEKKVVPEIRDMIQIQGSSLNTPYSGYKRKNAL